MATPQSAPALDLSSTQARPFVRIDHVDYDIRITDDFTLPELRELERLIPRVVPLVRALEAGTADDAQCEELSTLLTALLTLALAAPLAVIEKIGDVNKVRIFRVFIDLLPSSLREARATLEALQSPGRTSKPGSNGSMAATSTRGRRRSRSAG
jgi:hypothetical protein